MNAEAGGGVDDIWASEQPTPALDADADLQQLQ